MEENMNEVSEIKKAADALMESTMAGVQEVQQLMEEKAIVLDEVEQSLREDPALRAAASAAIADAVEQKKNEIFDRIEEVKDKAPYGETATPDMTATKDVEALLDEIHEKLADAQIKPEEGDSYAQIYADVMSDLREEMDKLPQA